MTGYRSLSQIHAKSVNAVKSIDYKKFSVQNDNSLPEQDRTREKNNR
jgi:hypothetical protein